MTIYICDHCGAKTQTMGVCFDDIGCGELCMLCRAELTDLIKDFCHPKIIDPKPAVPAKVSLWKRFLNGQLIDCGWGDRNPVNP